MQLWRSLAWLVFLLMSCPAFAAAGGDTVVIVVRHAEKSDASGTDPGLSPAGQARAQALARSLVAAGVDAVFCTPFQRTRLTAAPTAEQAGVPLRVRDTSADASATARLVAEIRALPPGSTVLVVGHSNTVPALVEALGGARASPMGEAEYDRYTMVSLAPGAPARTLTARY
jgi:broad specificity phosphatase PhoE